MNPETIAHIQKAGEALRHASQSLAHEVQLQQTRVSEALATDAFNVASDAHFDDWKALARLAQSVAAMEEQLRQVYFAAGTVGGGKAFAQAPLLTSQALVAQEVVDVRARKVKRAAARAAEAGSASDSPTAAPLKGNAEKTLAFLRTRLSRRGFKRVTHSELIQGVPMAPGSVSNSIAALKTKGLLEEGERGHYRLA